MTESVDIKVEETIDKIIKKLGSTGPMTISVEYIEKVGEVEKNTKITVRRDSRG